MAVVMKATKLDELVKVRPTRCNK